MGPIDTTELTAAVDQLRRTVDKLLHAADEPTEEMYGDDPPAPTRSRLRQAGLAMGLD